MEKPRMSFGDPALIDKIVEEYMSQGHFDQMRRTLMTDLDTKPSYQNVTQRIENTVQSFLVQQSWRPNLNKNQLRDSLKRQIMNAPFLRPGVKRIVDQLVNRSSIIEVRPQLEDIAKSLTCVESNPSSSNDVPGEQMDITEDTPSVVVNEEETQMIVVTEEETVTEEIKDIEESPVDKKLVDAMQDLTIPQSALSSINIECEETPEADVGLVTVAEEPEDTYMEEPDVPQESNEGQVEVAYDSDHSISHLVSPNTPRSLSPAQSPDDTAKSSLTSSKRASDFIGKIPKLKKSSEKTETLQEEFAPQTTANKDEGKDERTDKKNDQNSNKEKGPERSKEKGSSSSSSSREKEKRTGSEKSVSSDDRRKDYESHKYRDKKDDRDRHKDRSSNRSKERSADRDRGRDRYRDKYREGDKSRKERDSEQVRKDSDKSRDSHSSRDRDRKPRDRSRDKYDSDRSHSRKDSTKDRDRREGDRNRDKKYNEKERKDNDRERVRYGDRSRDRRENERARDDKGSREKSDSKSGKHGSSGEIMKKDDILTQQPASMEVESQEKQDRRKIENVHLNSATDSSTINSEINVKTVSDDSAPNTESNIEPPRKSIDTRHRKRTRGLSIEMSTEKMMTNNSEFDKESNIDNTTKEATNLIKNDDDDDNNTQSQALDEASRDSQDSASSKEREQLPPKYKIGTVSPILTRSKGKKVTETVADNSKSSRVSKRVAKRILK